MNWLIEWYHIDTDTYITEELCGSEWYITNIILPLVYCSLPVVGIRPL